MTELITIKELAERLKISRVTLYLWRRDGKIPHYVTPSGNVRFDPIEIEDWLKDRKIDALKIGQ